MQHLSDSEIEGRLRFADLILNDLQKHGKERKLPEHLERERQALLAEQRRRVENIGGGGI